MAEGTTVDDQGKKVRTVSPGVMSVGLVLVPNVMMLQAHNRGATKMLVDLMLASRIGAGGLVFVPFFGLAMEKVWYDTALSVQGVDPTAARPDRKDEGFPAGGHSFPSFSLLPVRNLFGAWGSVPLATDADSGGP
jgi:hypothetical protein